MWLIRLLRKVAFWEATLFLILLVATAVKYSGHGAVAVAVIGSVHGTVFTVYLILVLLVRSRLRWSLLTTLSILIAGFVPGGGYAVERWALNGARVDAAATGRPGRSPQVGAAGNSRPGPPVPVDAEGGPSSPTPTSAG